uniref:Uncharacterized protein n=1 Tax=Lepeophtheirus salmonis TaxID=72036 RepID=A0A0K2VBX7_LEPSM
MMRCSASILSVIFPKLRTFLNSLKLVTRRRIFSYLSSTFKSQSFCCKSPKLCQSKSSLSISSTIISFSPGSFQSYTRTKECFLASFKYSLLSPRDISFKKLKLSQTGSLTATCPDP